MRSGVLDFGRTAGELKRIRRKGWVSLAGIKSPESVADHTFRTAILVMCLSDLKGLDTEKLVSMALLHDVHEALIGDYDHYDKERIGESELRSIEVEAMKHIFSVLSDSLREKYCLLSIEFQGQETEEARLVRQIDQIEMIFQALEYEKEGYDRDKLQPFWDNVEEKLEDADLKKLFKLLKDERSKSIDFGEKSVFKNSTSSRMPRGRKEV